MSEKAAGIHTTLNIYNSNANLKYFNKKIKNLTNT